MYSLLVKKKIVFFVRVRVRVRVWLRVRVRVIFFVFFVSEKKKNCVLC